MQIMEGYDYTTGEFLWRNNNTVLDIGVNDADGGPNGPIILIDGQPLNSLLTTSKQVRSNGVLLWVKCRGA